MEYANLSNITISLITYKALQNKTLRHDKFTKPDRVRSELPVILDYRINRPTDDNRDRLASDSEENLYCKRRGRQGF
ncbi:hypothetical protein L596_011770 [Steinernema carpocapsae]|uniref:Uncharacterized protein n=1 Tax=Steinernema carpocapsae TaxID=34508 RepID=A0A4U5NVW6_STECR|nr:hypothetical protein L596_011770 [Steinernema carpocapsae]